ncbi:MAG: SCP2 sterol-binding domain-containing protein, partial [Halobacteria archaeon]|nr:SCP2 sterol-binding domain-containing protein [Halobacteria archaeon]
EDHEVFAYMEFYDGECTGVDVLDSLDERDAGFVVRGSYWDWDHFIRGDENIIKVALQGYLEPEGDMAKLMQYSDALNEMGEVPSELRGGTVARSP